MHSIAISLFSMVVGSVAFSSPLPAYGSPTVITTSSITTGVPIGGPDCFDENGTIHACCFDSQSKIVACPTTTTPITTTSTIPMGGPDCFDDNGNFVPCCFDSKSQITACPKTTTPVTTTAKIPIGGPDCFDDAGNFVPCCFNSHSDVVACPKTTSTAGPFKSNTTTITPDQSCCDTPGYCSCPSTPTGTASVITFGSTTITVPAHRATGSTPTKSPPTATFCFKDGHSSQCPVTTPTPTPKDTCTQGKGSPTVITFGTTTITVRPQNTTVTPPPVTATFCLSPGGYSSQCAVGTQTASVSTFMGMTCTNGNYWNGACFCGCGVVCSCAATFATSTRSANAPIY